MVDLSDSAFCVMFTGRYLSLDYIEPQGPRASTRTHAHTRPHAARATMQRLTLSRARTGITLSATAWHLYVKCPHALPSRVPFAMLTCCCPRANTGLGAWVSAYSTFFQVVLLHTLDIVENITQGYEREICVCVSPLPSRYRLRIARTSSSDNFLLPPTFPMATISW